MSCFDGDRSDVRKPEDTEREIIRRKNNIGENFRYFNKIAIK